MINSGVRWMFRTETVIIVILFFLSCDFASELIGGPLQPHHVYTKLEVELDENACIAFQWLDVCATGNYPGTEALKALAR